MAHRGKRFQVAARPAAKVQNLPGCRPFDMPQQGVDILADVVVAGAFAEVVGHAVVMA